MGLLDGLQPRYYATTCKVGTIIAGLSADDAKTLQDALDNDKKWTSHSLANALADKGINITRDTLAVHRAKTCRCYRQEL
jgi:hypothetical protein